MRLDPITRYGSDPVFHALVNVLVGIIQEHDYTPTELREAAMVAAFRHEMLTVRSLLVQEPPDDPA